MLNPRSWRPSLMLMPLLILLAGCAPSLPVYVQTAPPAIPSLPSEARQGPTPSICSPSCSAALMAERERWLQSLTDPAPQGSPASVPTTP